MKFKWQGLVYNLGTAKVVDFDEKTQTLYVFDHWSADEGGGKVSIVDDKKAAKRIWELYRNDAFDLDAEFPQGGAGGDDDDKSLEERLK